MCRKLSEVDFTHPYVATSWKGKTNAITGTWVYGMKTVGTKAITQIILVMNHTDSRWLRHAMTHHTDVQPS
jgi:hypothetical protein